MREWLIEAFHYDEWANRKWLAALDRLQDPAHGRKVLEHIVNAHRNWLDRCGYATPALELTLEEKVAAMPAAWREYLERADLDAPIGYKNVAGEEFTQPVREIVLHVLNHGTYHRGHLRGLADAQGLTDFEDTDLIRYFRTAR